MARRSIGTEAYTGGILCAGTSTRLFSSKATAVSAYDICSLPYPEGGTLDLSSNEKILVDDIVDYQRALIRLGEDSVAMKEPGHAALSAFTSVFTHQINTVFIKRSLCTRSQRRHGRASSASHTDPLGLYDWDTSAGGSYSDAELATRSRDRSLRRRDRNAAKNALTFRLISLF